MTTNGFMQSARGVGALISALMIASLGRFKYKGKLLTFGTIAFPVLLLIFAGIQNVWLSLLLLVGIGWAMILFFNLANALVQTHVHDELRGRVMGVYSFVFFGLIPIGALFAGALAGWIGEPLTVVLGASISLVIAIIVYFYVPQLRAME